MMRAILPLVAGSLLLACVASTEGAGPTGDGAGADSGSPATGRDAGGAADATTNPPPPDGGKPADAASDAPAKDGSLPTADPRLSLASCWTDVTCRRALVVSHGGDWDAITAPYGSHAAHVRAVAKGAHAIKVDALLSKDGVPVVAHSSKIQAYESLDCVDKVVEETNAADLVKCHLVPSFTETIQLLTDVVRYAKGKAVLEIDTKSPQVIAAVVATLIREGATDRAYLQIDVSDAQNVLPTVPRGNEAYYMPRIRDVSQIDLLIDTVKNPRLFLFEMDRTYTGQTEAQVGQLIAKRLHPAGVRAFTNAGDKQVSVQNHLDIFNQGFDVVMSYNLANGMEAAKQIDKARGLPPLP